MKFKYIPFKRYREIANDILRFYGYNEKSKIPIDPERIIRKMNIELVIINNLYKNHGIQGCVAFIKPTKKYQICIDNIHYYYQEKSSLFTMGEEIGHIILHKEGMEEIANSDDWQRVILLSMENNKKLHTQAKTLSSNIILPHFIFDNFGNYSAKLNRSIQNPEVRSQNKLK